MTAWEVWRVERRFLTDLTQIYSETTRHLFSQTQTVSLGAQATREVETVSESVSQTNQTLFEAFHCLKRSNGVKYPRLQYIVLLFDK